MYDSKPRIQMCQGHPLNDIKHVGSLNYVGGGGGRRYMRKLLHFTWLPLGLNIKKYPAIFLHIFARVMPQFESILRAPTVNISKKNHKSRRI